MSVKFRVTATKHDWDTVLGGWRCPALKIPGATIEKAYAESSEVDSALYKVQEGDEIIRWANNDPPDTVVFGIQLLKELSTQELTSRWKKLAIILPVLSPILIAAIAALFSLLAGNQQTNSNSRNATDGKTSITRSSPKDISILEPIESPDAWVADLIHMFDSSGTFIQNIKKDEMKTYYFQVRPYSYKAKEDTDKFIWQITPSDGVYGLTARAFKGNTDKSFFPLPQKASEKGIEFDVPQMTKEETLILIMFVEWEQDKVIADLRRTFISQVK